jgi:uncharacterized protein (DUF1330 family)
MKLLKLSPKLICTAILLTLLSCSKGDIKTEDAQIENLENNLSGSPRVETTKDNSYHFISFTIANAYLLPDFINQVKCNAKIYGGKLLTQGNPVQCLERNCSDRNLVIEFPNNEQGTKFFKNAYQAKLSNLAKIVVKNLIYSIGEESISTENDSIDVKVYSVFTSTILNPTRYITEYVPIATKVSNRYKGNIISAGLTKCMIGNCNTYTALVGYGSKDLFIKRYYDIEYAPVIPIRMEITSGGGLFYAFKEY